MAKVCFRRKTGALTILLISFSSYGKIYAGRNNKLLLSYLCLGRVYPATEWPTPESGSSPIRGKCEPVTGFDSHYVVVRKLGDDGYPCLPEMTIQGDELVVFRSEQVRALFVVFSFVSLITLPCSGSATLHCALQRSTCTAAQNRPSAPLG